MRKFFTLFIVTIILFACQTGPKGDTSRFQEGVFEIPAGESYSKTIITRKDSLQIEEYTKFVEVSTDSTVTRKEIKKIDTLYITWEEQLLLYLKNEVSKKGNRP